ncbi:hypothetical protein HAX54_051755 [Datura stramonium]|uniref:Protein kinase domain-containing protein n=1 Tax=Datura stramonium TaxID=4076 RepID=A0ABS8WPX8_DATST|nr:hypothetical protein [Datura stramonium]
MDDCFCAAPFGVGLRLRSPSISDFPPHYSDFEQWITNGVNMSLYQLYIHSVAWQSGPRLRVFLKIFPPRINDSRTNDFGKFNDSEVERIANKFATFNLTGSDIFGPYDLLNFTAMGYSSVLFPPLGGGKSRTNRGIVVGIVLGSICAAVVLLMAIIFVLLKMRRRFHVSKDQPLPNPMRIEGVKALGFKELESATNSFSSTTEIGQGGYGKVYKGILTEGTIVAIKRAQQGSLQGEKEFYTEIELLSRVHHRNLVSLVGYCNEGSEQMLVYEFMPNGSLHDLLSARYGERLSLGTRLYIALGAARGILYLHTEAYPPIIHRDIKANNILLDSKFTAKVSDFGISRLAPLPDDAETIGDVSTVVKGTPGYLDPEYFFTHKLTEKSDVYSLGIVFLELLTGMRPISHGRNIVREVNAACQSGMMSSIIDRSIGPYSSDCVEKFLDLALRCSMDEQKDRPSMLEVVRELEDITYMLPASFDNNIATNVDVSTSGMSSSPPTSTYSRHTTTYTTMEGIELVSGVIPSIKPR